MESLKDVIQDKYRFGSYKLESIYRKKYDEDVDFRKLANSLDMNKEELMKYTSKLECSVCEIKNCRNCHGLSHCLNEVAGYVYYPSKNEKNLEFSYVPCEYQKNLINSSALPDNIYFFDIPKEIMMASMRDIIVTDKNRHDTIKWIKNYLTDNKKGIYHKGLYLNGNFGCGKTYLLSAMLNELAKNGKRVAIVYYPEFLRSLKEAFSSSFEYKNKYNFIKKVDYLLLDDIGADSVTEWSRDEVLGPILQYRMEEKLNTFFTSNLTLKELEEHLAVTSRDIDALKSRRIIERIRQLTDNITMISENKRK